MISSLILTIATCLSGVQSISNADNLGSISSEASDIIEKAASAYDYSAFDLDENAQSSLAKQKLFAYEKEQGTLGKIGERKVSSLIESSLDYTYFANMDELYLKEAGSAERIAYEQSVAGFKSALSGIDVGTLSVCRPSDVPAISTTRVDSSHQSIYGTGGGSSATYEAIPIYEYEEANIAFADEGFVDGAKFYGIICSSAACVAVYNVVTKYINKQLPYVASNTKGPLGIIYEAIKLLSGTATPLGALISNAISKITTGLSSILKTVLNFFTSGTLLSYVIGSILVVVGIVCIRVFAEMIVYGSLEKGFALGFLRHSWLNWEFYDGEIV